MNGITDAMNKLSEASQEYERMKLTQKRIYDILIESFGPKIESEKQQVLEGENNKLKACLVEIMKLGEGLKFDAANEILKKYGITIDTSKL